MWFPSYLWGMADEVIAPRSPEARGVVSDGDLRFVTSCSFLGEALTLDGSVTFAGSPRCTRSWSCSHFPSDQCSRSPAGAPRLSSQALAASCSRRP